MSKWRASSFLQCPDTSVYTSYLLSTPYGYVAFIRSSYPAVQGDIRLGAQDIDALAGRLARSIAEMQGVQLHMSLFSRFCHRHRPGHWQKKLRLMVAPLHLYLLWDVDAASKLSDF